MSQAIDYSRSHDSDQQVTGKVLWKSVMAQTFLCADVVFARTQSFVGSFRWSNVQLFTGHTTCKLRLATNRNVYIVYHINSYTLVYLNLPILSTTAQLSSETLMC